MATDATWGQLAGSQWRDLNSSEILPGSAVIVTRHRWYHSTAISYLNVYDDYFYIAENVTIETTKYVDETDPVALSEAVTKTIGRPREEWVDVYEAITKEVQKPASDTVDISDVLESYFIRNRSYDDEVGVSESTTFDVAWVKVEEVGVGEEITFDVTWVFSDDVQITEDVIVKMQIVEEHIDQIGLTDSAQLVVFNEVVAMSLIDDVRAAVQTAFSLSDAQVAVLSINDLLHLYWSGDFPIGHTYDGSESTLSPVEAYSIFDHHAEVEKNEGTDLNWIRGVTAT